MMLTVRNLLSAALLGVWSCSTNDVDLIPQAQIQASATVMPENGGTPTGSFGGAVVQTTTTGAMNLNNAGDLLTITDAQDSVMITFDVAPFSDNPNESYTRSPDITGEFVQHSTVGSGTLLFSPGTRLDGSPF